ncbi:hypothetical protein C7M84_008816 [Penaeus vannamei]|uniref:Uncharacterized protein n=1 Tax=Penaeus vannamei TaxID=6689 RepID=A0A3R7PI81_PENVA|nr:hypothetical protein C7M84_008816 [Penaeus vannamei]
MFQKATESEAATHGTEGPMTQLQTAAGAPRDTANGTADRGRRTSGRAWVGAGVGGGRGSGRAWVSEERGWGQRPWVEAGRGRRVGARSAAHTRRGGRGWLWADRGWTLRPRYLSIMDTPECGREGGVPHRHRPGMAGEEWWCLTHRFHRPRLGQTSASSFFIFFPPKFYFLSILYSGSLPLSFSPPLSRRPFTTPLPAFPSPPLSPLPFPSPPFPLLLPSLPLPSHSPPPLSHLPSSLPLPSPLLFLSPPLFLSLSPLPSPLPLPSSLPPFPPPSLSPPLSPPYTLLTSPSFPTPRSFLNLSSLSLSTFLPSSSLSPSFPLLSLAFLYLLSFLLFSLTIFFVSLSFPHLFLCLFLTFPFSPPIIGVTPSLLLFLALPSTFFLPPFSPLPSIPLFLPPSLLLSHFLHLSSIPPSLPLALSLTLPPSLLFLALPSPLFHTSFSHLTSFPPPSLGPSITFPFLPFSPYPPSLLLLPLILLHLTSFPPSLPYPPFLPRSSLTYLPYLLPSFSRPPSLLLSSFLPS